MSNLNKLKEWNYTFGRAWDVLTKKYPGIGGFILRQSDRKAMLDDNVPSILGLDSECDYHQVYQAITDDNPEKAYSVTFIDRTDSVITGFVLSRKRAKNV